MNREKEIAMKAPKPRPMATAHIVPHCDEVSALAKAEKDKQFLFVISNENLCLSEMSKSAFSQVNSYLILPSKN